MKLRGIYVGIWYTTRHGVGVIVAVKDEPRPYGEVAVDVVIKGKRRTMGADDITREARLEEIPSARCVCRGLGAYVDWNGSTNNPAYEVHTCEDHAIPEGEYDKENAIDVDDRGAQRVDEALDAVADARDILFKRAEATLYGLTKRQLVEILLQLRRTFDFAAATTREV